LSSELASIRREKGREEIIIVERASNPKANEVNFRNGC